MKKPFILTVLFGTFFSIILFPQATQIKITDSNTPLHALQPEYPVPYGAMKNEDITAVLNRIYNFLDPATPPNMVNRQTKAIISDLKRLSPDVIFEPGIFRLVSYEWGVAYGAMLLAAEATGDTKYREYTLKRINLIGDVSTWFRDQESSAQKAGNPVRSVLEPRSLDDAGSMCAAMIKTLEAGGKENLRPIIDNYIDYITNGQQRFEDGTLARNRPLPNTLWLDDLYMSVPALAQMGKLTGDMKYFDDAAKQVIQFSQRMFNREKALFMHGWVQGMTAHPEFFWGRCNGWALLAISELLDVLPADHPARDMILGLFRNHVKGLVSFQGASGFWHQLIDRPDSYFETSATAIFTYCIAHGVNRGWLDPQAFGPAAVLGWNAAQTRVNDEGQVEGTCVGTGMAFDPAFYYHRPVNVAAAHGYGPAIMAGAEMIKLNDNFQIEINDSAVMLYPRGYDWKKNTYQQAP